MVGDNAVNAATMCQGKSLSQALGSAHLTTWSPHYGASAETLLTITDRLLTLVSNHISFNSSRPQRRHRALGSLAWAWLYVNTFPS